MLISKYIKEFCNAVIRVENGVDAVEACRKNPDIDLILMDVRMPQMCGDEATRQIRKFNKEVIIIAQTAHGLSGDREKSIEAGCNDHITKPIDRHLLKEMIQRLIRK